jgi:hypothetical protein
LQNIATAEAAIPWMGISIEKKGESYRSKKKNGNSFKHARILLSAFFPHQECEN